MILTFHTLCKNKKWLTELWVQRFVRAGRVTCSPGETQPSEKEFKHINHILSLTTSRFILLSFHFLLPWTRSERRSPQTELSETSPSPAASSPSPAPPVRSYLKTSYAFNSHIKTIRRLVTDSHFLSGKHLILKHCSCFQFLISSLLTFLFATIFH